MPTIRWIEYRELAPDDVKSLEFPSLKQFICATPQEHEEDIARYLEFAPNYCALGTVASDVLDPSAEALLFPGRNTDGIYGWPSELGYYVRKYHLSLPKEFIEHMQASNWLPPNENELDWDKVFPGSIAEK